MKIRSKQVHVEIPRIPNNSRTPFNPPPRNWLNQLQSRLIQTAKLSLGSKLSLSLSLCSSRARTLQLTNKYAPRAMMHSPGAATTDTKLDTCTRLTSQDRPFDSSGGIDRASSTPSLGLLAVLFVNSCALRSYFILRLFEEPRCATAVSNVFCTV